MKNTVKHGLLYCAVLFLAMSSAAALAANQPNHAMTLSPNKVMQAARSGDADAEYALGYMMYYGKGMKQDIDGSYQWFQKAAAQGQPQAIKALEILRQSNHPGIATVSHQPGQLTLHPHDPHAATASHAVTASPHSSKYPLHPAVAPHSTRAPVSATHPQTLEPHKGTADPHHPGGTMDHHAGAPAGPVLHMQNDSAAVSPHAAPQTPHLAPIPVDPQQPPHTTPAHKPQQHTTVPSQHHSLHPMVAPHAAHPVVTPHHAPAPMQHPSTRARPVQQSATALSHMMASSRHQLSLMPAHHFVIQLMSARSTRSVIAFMQQHRIHDGHLYQTKRNGRTWMILVQGDYASHAAALRALRANYSHLKNKPWIKSVAAVQRELMR